MSTEEINYMTTLEEFTSTKKHFKKVTPFSYFLQICVILAGAVGVGTNGVMVAVLMKVNKRMKHNPSHILIINQNFVDMFACIAIIIDFTQKCVTDGWAYDNNALGIFRCMLWDSDALAGSLLSGSMAGLMIVTMERYMKIAHSSYYAKNYKIWMLKVAIVFPWALGFIECFVPLVITTYIADGFCYPVRRWMNRPLQVIYGYYCAFIYLMLPTAVFVFGYGRIAYFLWRHSKTSSITGSNMPSKKINKSTVNVTKTLAIVSFFYCLSVLPIVTVYCMNIVGFDLDRRSEYWDTFMILLFVNSLLNPLIYAWQYDVVKDFFKKVKTTVSNYRSTTITPSAATKTTVK